MFITFETGCLLTSFFVYICIIKITIKMNKQPKFHDGSNLYVFTNDKTIKEPGDIVADVDNYLHIFTENDGKEYGLTTKKCHIYAAVPVETTHNGLWYIDQMPDEDGDLQTVKYQRKDVLMEMASSTEQRIVSTSDPLLDNVRQLNVKIIQEAIDIINKHNRK